MRCILLKFITPVLCLYKFWKNYGTFINIWSMLWKILSLITIVVCSIEFNLFLGAVWINDLFWLFDYIKWYETYRVDFSLYFLFEVIFLNLNAVCGLSYSFLSKSWSRSPKELIKKPKWTPPYWLKTRTKVRKSPRLI